MTVEQKKDFGDTIREKRTKMNLSQVHCAKYCGVSLNQYRQYEYGISTPTAERMRRLCTLFSLHEEDYEE